MRRQAKFVVIDGPVHSEEANQAIDIFEKISARRNRPMKGLDERISGCQPFIEAQAVVVDRAILEKRAGEWHSRDRTEPFIEPLRLNPVRCAAERSKKLGRASRQ